MDPSIIFMGSPEFALPSLRRLAEQYPIAGVVTQPDRPAGRGNVLTPPPVKSLAEQLHLPVIQPVRLREPAAWQQLVEWEPDLIVVAAFGQILRQEILNLPRFGCINVHGSMLPRWRGAAPIQAAILHGDAQTGISIMKMEAGVDTGPILSQKALPIEAGDTSGTLSQRMAPLGADLLLETLPGYLSGTLALAVQDESQATYAPMLRKEDGLLDFQQPAKALERRVRACHPWPGAYTLWKGQILKIHRAHVVTGKTAVPGSHVIIDDLPAIASIDGLLVLDELQPAGKKVMPGRIYLNGVHDWLAPV
jgi:methionyl-tRNA formyltransferase